MLRFVPTHGWGLAFLVWLITLVPVCGQELPKGEDLMDKYVKVTGGKDAYAKIKTRVLKGTVTLAGVKGKMTRYMQAPNLMYEEVKLPNVPMIMVGTDGKVAWEYNPLSGPRIHQEEMRRLLLREATLDNHVVWRQFFKTATTKKEIMIDKKPTYRVDLVSAKGDKQTRFFDTRTGLLVRIRDTITTDKGQEFINTDILEYKTYDGVALPVKLRRTIQKQQIHYRVTNVQHNGKIPASRFALPKKVQQLLKGT